MREWLSGISREQKAVYFRFLVNRLVRQTRDNCVIKSKQNLNKMREWLSGRASPCQGEGREFESRLALCKVQIVYLDFF